MPHRAGVCVHQEIVRGHKLKSDLIGWVLSEEGGPCPILIIFSKSVEG